MTAIFISHSSADNAAAWDMKAWLEQQGHTSLFLDFDPEAGIRAGGDWEETLYYKLRQCQAVVALLTPSWLASKWCFAELVQAREKGKAIFPVKVQPCDTSVFGDVQHIDLTEKPEEGYQRLAIGLRERGLDPLDVFDWDPKRPPYPGLLAFQEEDAAIFFGRGEEILNGLETLDALRRRGRGAPRFVLFLGASGSGKSSLVRAGLIPRLKKTPSEWLPLAPFRPQDDPLDELALALADKFEDLGRPQDWGEIGQKLKATAEQEGADGKALLALVRELAITARQREATVVLTIDQAEELFGYSSAAAASRFWRLLRAALEASDRQLIALATMRSDFLGEFQAVRALHDPAYDHDFAYQAVPVDPMPERNFVEIIRGPARLAGLRLEDGLVEAMVGDAGTRDALPLLAFTLRRLYDRYGADGLLDIREYEELGRLEGAIRAEADRVLAEAQPSPADLEALRAAFVPTMVRINAEGDYARRRAHADEMPPRAKTLLGRFIDARLLISDRDQDGQETVEVAHEALLRTWPQLSGWLAEDQDKLRLLESIQRAAEEWDGGGRPADLLVHRDGRLKDAEALLTDRRFALSENSLEKRYLNACIEAQHTREAAEREEQERRVRDAERIAEEQKKAAAAQKKTAQRTLVGLVVAVLLAAASGVIGLVAYQSSVAARAELALNQWNNGVLNRDHLDQPVEAAHWFALAAESPDPSMADDARLALADLLRSIRLTPVEVWDHDPGLSGRLRGGPSRLMTGDGEGNLMVWDFTRSESPRSFPLVHEGFRGAMLDPAARRVASWSRKTVHLWDVLTGKPVWSEPVNHDKVSSVAFSLDGTQLVSWSVRRGDIQLWNAETGKPVWKEPLALGEGVLEAVFSDDGERLLTQGILGQVQLFLTATGQPLWNDPERHLGIHDAIFSPEGEHVLSWGDRGSVRLWSLATGEAVWHKEFPTDGWNGAAFTRDGSRILLWGTRGTVAMLRRSNGEEFWQHEGRAFTVGQSGMVGATFTRNQTRVLAWGYRNSVWLWDVLSGKPAWKQPIAHEEAVRGAILSSDERYLLTWSADGTMRIWDVLTRRATVAPIRHKGGALGAMFNADETRILSWGPQTLSVWELSSRAAEGTTLAGLLRVAFNPDETGTVALYGDGKIVFRDLEMQEVQEERFRQVGNPLDDAAFSDDGNRALTWSRRKPQFGRGGDRMSSGRADIELIDMAASKIKWKRDPTARAVDGATFSRDGEHILTWESDLEREGAGNVLQLRSASTGEPIWDEPVPHSGLRGAVLSADGASVLSWGYEGKVMLTNAVTGKKVWQKTFEEDVQGIAFADDGAGALAWSSNRMRLLRLDSGDTLWEASHGQSVRGAVFGADGGRILSWGEDGTVRLSDAATGKELWPEPARHEDWVRGAAFDADGARILSWSEDGTVRLWNAATGQALIAPLRHAHPAIGARLDTTGARVLTMSMDGVLRLWNAMTGQPLVSSFYGRVTAATFDSGGTRVLSWDRDGMIKMWDLSYDPKASPENLKLAAQALTGTSLDESGELEVLPIPHWRRLRDEYRSMQR